MTSVNDGGSPNLPSSPFVFRTAASAADPLPSVSEQPSSPPPDETSAGREGDVQSQDTEQREEVADKMYETDDDDEEEEEGASSAGSGEISIDPHQETSGEGTDYMATEESGPVSSEGTGLSHVFGYARSARGAIASLPGRLSWRSHPDQDVSSGSAQNNERTADQEVGAESSSGGGAEQASSPVMLLKPLSEQSFLDRMKRWSRGNNNHLLPIVESSLNESTEQEMTEEDVEEEQEIQPNEEMSASKDDDAPAALDDSSAIPVKELSFLERMKRWSRGGDRAPEVIVASPVTEPSQEDVDGQHDETTDQPTPVVVDGGVVGASSSSSSTSVDPSANNAQHEVSDNTNDVTPSDETYSVEGSSQIVPEIISSSASDSQAVDQQQHALVESSVDIISVDSAQATTETDHHQTEVVVDDSEVVPESTDQSSASFFARAQKRLSVALGVSVESRGSSSAPVSSDPTDEIDPDQTSEEEEEEENELEPLPEVPQEVIVAEEQEEEDVGSQLVDHEMVVTFDSEGDDDDADSAASPPGKPSPGDAEKDLESEKESGDSSAASPDGVPDPIIELESSGGTETVEAEVTAVSPDGKPNSSDAELLTEDVDSGTAGSCDQLPAQEESEIPSGEITGESSNSTDSVQSPVGRPASFGAATLAELPPTIIPCTPGAVQLSEEDRIMQVRTEPIQRGQKRGASIFDSITGIFSRRRVSATIPEASDEGDVVSESASERTDDEETTTITDDVAAAAPRTPSANEAREIAERAAAFSAFQSILAADEEARLADGGDDDDDEAAAAACEPSRSQTSGTDPELIQAELEEHQNQLEDEQEEEEEKKMQEELEILQDRLDDEAEVTAAAARSPENSRRAPSIFSRFFGGQATTTTADASVAAAAAPDSESLSTTEVLPSAPSEDVSTTEVLPSVESSSSIMEEEEQNSGAAAALDSESQQQQPPRRSLFDRFMFRKSVPVSTPAPAAAAPAQQEKQEAQPTPTPTRRKFNTLAQKTSPRPAAAAAEQEVIQAEKLEVDSEEVVVTATDITGDILSKEVSSASSSSMMEQEEEEEEEEVEKKQQPIEQVPSPKRQTSLSSLLSSAGDVIKRLSGSGTGSRKRPAEDVDIADATTSSPSTKKPKKGGGDDDEDCAGGNGDSVLVVDEQEEVSSSSSSSGSDLDKPNKTQPFNLSHGEKAKWFDSHNRHIFWGKRTQQTQ